LGAAAAIDRRNIIALDQIRDATEKLNLEIYRRLVSLIVAGSWAPHHRIPSSRALARDLSVSRSTTALAIDRLVADGWAYAMPRKGVFVAAHVPHRGAARPTERAGTTSPVPFELSQGAVDVFPLNRWTKAQTRIWAAHMPDGLYEPDPQGDPSLRARLASMVLIERGIACSPDDIFIVSSTREALSLVARAMAPSCSRALVEDPGYLGGRAVLDEAGLPVQPVAVDRSGLVVDQLPHPEGRSDLLYVTPAAQFPTGTTLSLERRSEIERRAAGGGLYLFEDDYDWEHRFDGRPPPSALAAGMLRDQTFYSWSFSRLLFPSLRLAMLVVPERWRQTFISLRERMDGVVTLPNQLVLAEFIASGAFSAHRRHLRQICGARREAMLGHVRPYLGSLFQEGVNEAGLRLTLRCDPQRAQDCATGLRDRGIMCSTLSDLSSTGVADDGLVLGFAAFPEAVIDQCGAALAEAFDQVLSG